MLPAVLFTAAVFDLPKWADKQIRNLQKQFLWRHSTSTEASRHKMNPDLVFAPREAGGVGLASVQLACKSQRVKHTIQWLIQRRDTYFIAWKEWMFRGATESWQDSITPRKELLRGDRRRQTPGSALQQLIGEWLQPKTADLSAESIMQYSMELETLSKEGVSWRENDDWILELPRELPNPRLEMTKEDVQFWPTFRWNENPWIVDKSGKMLTTKKFARIAGCTIQDLSITRTQYSLKVPVAGEKSHRQPKLRRWALAILMNVPSVSVGETLQVTRQLYLRHPMQLQHEYVWETTGPGQVIGKARHEMNGRESSIILEQLPNGIHWKVKATCGDDSEIAADTTKMQRFQHQGSIIFYAHPRIHGFPWRVQDSIANRHVLVALKRQPFKRYKGAGATLARQLIRLEEVMQNSTWQAALMQQTPKQLWAHHNELTEYQVWVSYRLAVRQLNLYYAGKAQHNGCRKLTECYDTKETLEHIFWECPCAQACWIKLIRSWTGETWQEGDIGEFQEHCASRKAPSLSRGRKDSIQRYYPDSEKEYTEVWSRMWRILSSICVTSIWIQRNRVVFKHKAVTAETSIQEFWTTGMRQLKALAKRERRSPDKQIQGTRLFLCQLALESQPREQPPQVAGPVQPPDLIQAPALLTRLRTYQASSHH